MRTIKMIGLDLDGTLLNREKKLTTYSKEILKEAICQGMIVLVATGRPLLGVPDFMREFPGMRYILTANGARIYDREDGNRLLYENLLSREDACTVLDVFEEYDTLKDVYYDGVGYANRLEVEHLERYYEDPAMREYIWRTRKRVENVRDKMKEYSFGLDKIQAVFAKRSEREEAMRRLKEKTDLAVTGALANSIEVNSGESIKETACLCLERFLALRRKRSWHAGMD